MTSYWFISKDGKVVVEAHGSNDDKEYAVTWNLTSPFRTQSITTADGGKTETFLNDDYYLLRKYFRKWSKSERWVVDRRIDKLFSEKDLSAVQLKSKCLLFYYSYLSDGLLCPCQLHCPSSCSNYFIALLRSWNLI